MAVTTTITRQNVKIIPAVQNLSGELSDRIHYQCAFCEKTVGLYPAQRKLCERLSGHEFFCVSCIRLGFNKESNKNVLPLSFKAIAGYYYFEKYAYTNHRQMWLTEIQEFLDSHEQVGLLNPLFSYDRESLVWFVDFNKVGKGRHKVRVSEVYKTIINMLACFNLADHIPNIKMAKLYEKYATAIEKFYTQRYRPADKKLLIPTLAGCGPFENKKFPLDNTRMFMPKHLNYL